MSTILRVLTLFAACLLTSGAAPASAAPPCAKRSDVVYNLAQKYSEIPAARGLAAGSLMIEVFTSAEGTFTIVVTRPDGMSCLIAAGTSWRHVDATLNDKES